MFENEEQEEEFREMLRQDKRQHEAIYSGVREVIQSNACPHFNIYGNFVVGRVIVISEVLDEYGEVHLMSFGSPDLRPWEIKGMISYVNSTMTRDEI
jgi:hypothetical protein